MKHPMSDLGIIGWYSGIFTTSGVGIATGSGSENCFEDMGQGLSCGEGFYEYFSSSVGFSHTGTGRGNAIGSGSVCEPGDEPILYISKVFIDNTDW